MLCEVIIYFRLSVVKEFLSILNQNCSLGFSLLSIKRARVNGNLRVGNSGDRTFRTSGDDQTLLNVRFINRGT